MEALPRLRGAGTERWRTAASVLLIVVACLLTPVAVASAWMTNEVVDTDRFVATARPLASDPAVQAAVADQVTTAIADQVNVAGLVANATSVLSSAVGDRLKLDAVLGPLAAPLASGITEFIHAAVEKVVTSSAFATLWAGAVRTAHSAAIATLTGSHGVIGADADRITVDLGPVVDRARQVLVSEGFTLANRIPEVHTEFVVAESGSLHQARSGFRLLQALGDWLPATVAVLFAGGILLANHRRTALVGSALGIAAAVAVLGIALAVIRTVYVNDLPSDVQQAAVTAVYDAFLRFLRVTLRVVGGVAVAVALVAYFTGPSDLAVRIRGLFKSVPS